MAVKLSQKEISLDLQHQGFTNTIYVQEGDVHSRELTISLFDDGEEYNISSSSKVYLSGERSDKAVVSREVDSFTNNIIKVVFRNEEICAKGISKYKIIIKDADDVLSSVYFKVKVYENVYDENGILATPQYSELQEAIKKADSMDDFHNKLDEHYFVLTEDKDIAGGVPSLDSNTKVPVSKLYEATTSNKGITQLTDSVTSTSITTAATPNSVKSVKDSLNSEINRATEKENKITNNLSSHTSNTSNPHGVTKSQVGLGNVENKSSATIRGEITKSNVTTALGYTPMNQALKGASNGVAELNESGKVPSSQLPSFVDDVIEGYLSGGKFYKEPAHTTEISGETGKIYIDLSTNKTYRWSGSAFVVISETLALGETSSTAYRGDRGKTAYDHSQSTHAPSNAQQNVQSDWNATSGDAFIKNKPTIPTKVGELTNDKDYATKTEVTEAIDDIEIGGRNYILFGSGKEKKGFFENFALKDTDGYCMHRLVSKKQYESVSLRPGYLIQPREYPVGSKVTFSYDIMYTEWNFPEGYDRKELWIGQRYTSQSISGGDTTGAYRGVTTSSLPVVGVGGCELNKWFHVEKTLTIPELAAEGITDVASVQFYNSNADVEASVTFKLRNVKLEYGNKATDWTPAIEDTEAEIQSVESQITTNLLNPTLGTTTVNGVTCTNNGDGTYTLNGTATNDVIIKFYTTLKAGTYKFIGTPPNIESSYCRYWLEEGIGGDDDGEGFVRTLTKTTTFSFNLYVKKEYTVNNVIFKLMVTTNLNATYDDFVPYTGSTGQINSDVAEVRKDFDEHTHEIADVTGLQSALDGKAASSHTHSAYVNQNAFSNVTVGSTTVSADTTTDTLTLAAGSNVTITPDATNDKITISSTDTKYTHPTSSGNKHIPSGGSSGQILRWSADGTAVWGNDNNTTYSNFVKSGSGAKAGLVPAPSTTAGTTKYLREDGTWANPSLDSVGYEEGTWSPTEFTMGDDPSSIFYLHDGHYKKIGNVVIATCKASYFRTEGDDYVSIDCSSLPFPITSERFIQGSYYNAYFGSVKSLGYTPSHNTFGTGSLSFSANVPSDHIISIVYSLN